ncbi:conserved hypothetical protein [Candidatus Desulforudis audaxviator MP104C]|uniref:CNNM transmembrane domain-containing protein n=1 Tax=Desulforudis audaxviator (strain MP104C) TaxID=477974 RepID=B1I3J5_DESAP|nr:hypothetical protein [Candidatus Desulforudis audaxviator]ACA59538.1 conserved hypothetical protein [Candidatus Desulforudis audaxviator MP104C]
MANDNGPPSYRHLVMVGLGTLVATIVISLFAETTVRQVANLGIALFLLVIIIAINVVFDIIGTAAAASREAPFHAKAAKKVFGAQHSVYLVRNRDKVANFTQDVIGDIAGIVAGALGIGLITRVVLTHPDIDAIVFSVLITAVIASLIVTGKAYGKRIAVRRATQIIFIVGKILAGFERLVFWRAEPGRRQRKSR